MLRITQVALRDAPDIEITRHLFVSLPGPAFLPVRRASSFFAPGDHRVCQPPERRRIPSSELLQKALQRDTTSDVSGATASSRMNQCDRRGGDFCDSKAETDNAAQARAVPGGARPKSKQGPPKNGAKTRAGNARRAGGDRKFSRSPTPSGFAPRPDKSGAFDSLLKRAHRRRGTCSDQANDKTPEKQGASSVDSVTQRSDVKDVVAEDVDRAQIIPASVEDNSSGYTRKPIKKEKSEDVVEYTILARPPSKVAPPAGAGPVKSVQEEDCDVFYESNDKQQFSGIVAAAEDHQFNAAIQPGTSGRLDEDHVGPSAICVPCHELSPEQCDPMFPHPFEGSQHSSTFSPQQAPPIWHGYANKNFGFSTHNDIFLPGSMPDALHYLAYPPLPPPNSPGMPPYALANAAPPFPPNGYLSDKYLANRRRTKSSSFARRLPERRLYDSHGRWVGQERRQSYDSGVESPCGSDCVDHQTKNRDGLGFNAWVGNNATEQRNRTDSFQNYGRRHSSASWSPSTLPEDDIEDLLPLIDQLAIEYPNSDSSTEGPTEPLIPDEDTWFSVLPSTTNPEDRFVWSSRRDLHRPKSIWSPLKPRLGGYPQDNLKEAFARIRYRARTYTENVSRRSSETMAQGRRTMSCDFPRFDKEASSDIPAVRGGWSPWSGQLPTADSLNVSS